MRINYYYSIQGHPRVQWINGWFPFHGAVLFRRTFSNARQRAKYEETVHSNITTARYTVTRAMIMYYDDYATTTTYTRSIYILKRWDRSIKIKIYYLLYYTK